MIKPFKYNLPVALIYFNRPNLLNITFNALREQKPSKLFLIQDGARKNNKEDYNDINECRKIVENIDWKCEVYKNYSEKNLGCGRRVFSGISWAFTYVDRLIIVEDDCVTGKGFFDFCEYALEKYKDDKRISMISGMNNLDVYHKTPYDYFFSEGGTIWGWATWKRVWDTIDFNIDWIEDKDAIRLLTNKYGKYVIQKGKILRKKIKKGVAISSWSFQHGINMYLHSGLIIVPKYNLTSNIGLTNKGANTKASELQLLPKSTRKLYFKKIYSMNYPLKSPKYVINDIEYLNKFKKSLSKGFPFLTFIRRLETKFYNIYNKIICKYRKKSNDI